MRSGAMKKGRSFALLRQQWLREHATMLRCYLRRYLQVMQRTHNKENIILTYRPTDTH